MSLTARDVEAALLNRCMLVARGAEVALDQREANVIRLAAMVLRSAFPIESDSLMAASQRYFAAHPSELLHPSEVIRKGWVVTLPRLRDMLSRQLSITAPC